MTSENVTADPVAPPKGENLERAPCPESEACFLSKLFLAWVFPLVYKGWKTSLKDEDLWELRDFERASHTSGNLLAVHKDYVRKGITRNIFAKSLIRIYRIPFIVTFVLKGFTVALKLVQPILFSKLIHYFQDAHCAGVSVPKRNGLIWALSLLITSIAHTIAENQYILLTLRAGMGVRSAAQGIIYDKMLRMSPSARAGSSLGEIVNLMQLDTQRVGNFAHFCHEFWWAPIQLIISVALLFKFIRWSAAIGLAATVLVLPLPGHFMAVQVRLQKQGVAITDRRVKLMNEILQGIKGIKFYAWEQPFSAQAEKERAQEVNLFEKTIWAKSIFAGVMFSIPLLITVITFACYRGIFRRELEPATVFTGITLLDALREPVMMVPWVAPALIDTRIAIKRIERFLCLEDTDDYARKDKGTLKKSDKGPDGISSQISDSPGEKNETNGEVDTAEYQGEPERGGGRNGHIRIENAAFSWGDPGQLLTDRAESKKKLFDVSFFKKNGEAPATEESGELAERNKAAREEATNPRRANFLENTSLEMTPGRLIAVVGRVGAGKSSLVHAILGEMQKVCGNVALTGSVAYGAQTACIFNDSLKNNILFGKEYDERLYQRAISVSALGPDIAVLPARDQTEIGEKGINLSGGQKQRVSIARAVYSDADVYLFDDPLSALDAQVSRTVFDKCISNRGALRNRLRLLTTNQVQVLSGLRQYRVPRERANQEFRNLCGTPERGCCFPAACQ